MLTIEQTRKILGKNAEGLTDEDLTKIRDGYRLMTEVIFEKWLMERKKEKEKKEQEKKSKMS